MQSEGDVFFNVQVGSAGIHASCDTLALVMTHGMCTQCAIEEPPREKISACNEDKLDVLHFYDFRTRVALTELKYDVVNCKHPGDNKMIKYNELSKNNVHQNYKRKR